MELKKDDTKMIQGISVVAMVLLHLFCRENYNELYNSLLYVFNVPVSFMIAQLSDFCVMGFAFCSGYAHYLMFSQNEKKYCNGRIKRLLNLYINFWTVCLVFCIISVLIGKSKFMPGSLYDLIMNLTTLSNTYNGAWWYLFIYALITVISPIILRILKNNKSWLVLIGTFIIYCLAYYVRFEINDKGFLLEKFGTFGMTLFEYYIGCIFYKERIFSKIKNIKFVKGNGLLFYLSSMICLSMLLFFRTFVIRSLFIAPISGLLIIIIFIIWDKPKFIEDIFLFIGNHATNIWLVHMFFYLNLFVDFVFCVKYPIFIFIFMMLLCIVSSYVINFTISILKRVLKLSY